MCKAASLSAGPGRGQQFPQAVAPRVILEDRQASPWLWRRDTNALHTSSYYVMFFEKNYLSNSEYIEQNSKTTSIVSV